MTLKTIPPRATGTQALTVAQTRDVYYSYDLRGLQTGARFDSQSGEGVTNHYDGFGRLASSASNMGGTARTLQHRYDRNGNRDRVTHPDGVQFDYAYDGLGRPTTLSDTAQALTHSYEPWGSVSAIVRNGGASGRWTTPDGRLISLSHYNGPSFTLDTVWASTHNPAGQIASQWGMSDAYAWTGAYAVQRPYTTNGLNQYSQTGSGAGTVAFAYDANGNLTTETPPSPAPSRTYVYDIENRLVGAPGSVVLTYDPLGRLYSVSSPSTDTRFLYDGDALVAEYGAGGALTDRYVHGADAGADDPLVWYHGTGTAAAARRNLLADHQGSIVAVSDNAANRLSINRYDEYGIPAAGNSGRFQYTGQIWLPDLGMYHYKARIYSPTLGRFLQTDPIGYDDQFNLYAYVGNDPVNRTDPSGLAICGSCSGYSIQVSSVNFAALGRRFDNFLRNTLAALQSRGVGLESCSTSQPAYICGMIRHMSPRAVATMRSLLENPDRFRVITNEYRQAIREDKEHGIWYDDNQVVLSRRTGWRTGVPFYPIPVGGRTFLHFHLVGIAEGRIPGLSNVELGLAAQSSTMMIVYNREFRRFYWVDYGR